MLVTFAFVHGDFFIVKNRLTYQTFHQHTLSPTSVTNIDITISKPEKDMLQKLDTQGNAWDWEHFELNGTFERNNGHYLIAANHYNGYSHITKSPILKFDKLNRNFVPTQYLQTHGASDWRHFK